MIAINSGKSCSPLLQFSEFLVKLHNLIAQGSGDTPEADELRDHMDTPWHDMNEQENRIASQLSEDLYLLESQSSLPHPSDDTFSPNLSEALGTARNANNYLLTLELLSKRSSEIGASRAMSLRGSSYVHLGMPDVAMLFYEKAVDFSANPTPALIGFLHSMTQAGKIEEAVGRALDILRNDAPRDTHLHQFCVLVILGESHFLDEPFKSERFREVKAALERLLDRLNSESDSISGAITDRQLFSLFLLADCCYMLGDTDEALKYLNRAITIDPEDEGSLVLRGLFAVSSDFASAVKDFSKAINVGTRAIMPYYYVAHDAIVSEEYDSCIAAASRGLKFRGDHEILASLHEMIAISLIKRSASLEKLPQSEIRKHFQTAAILSPFKASFQENSRKFEEMISRSTLLAWEIGRPLVASSSMVGNVATEYLHAASSAL